MRNTKLIYFLFAIFLIFHSAEAQDLSENLDSIKTVFEQTIIESKTDSIELIDAYYNYGKFFDDQGNYNASIEQMQKALQVSINSNNNEKIAWIANYLANVYWMTGDFDSSTKTYKIGLKSAEVLKDSSTIAKISMNMASNFNFLGDYDKAVKYALHALKIKETANDLERICYHYIAMGNIFRENNNDQKWEEYVQKAYIHKDIEGCANLSDIAKIYNSLGGIAVKREEYEKGLLYYDTLIQICKEANYNQGISAALTNSAGVYKQLNNFEKAIELSSESEKYFSENPYDSIFGNNFKTELYQLTGNYTEALKLAKLNISKSNILYYSTEKLKTLAFLYELNYSLSNYEEAFKWNDSLRNYENMLRDEDIRQSYEELETKYETEKKEQQIELLIFENKLKNQELKAGVALVAILFIVIFLILYILRIRKKQAILTQNELQQQVLRSQMNPHFIFNVLGSIQNFMMQNDIRKASDFLSQFAALTRATLTYSAAETISLSDEIKMLENYLELEKMRKTGSFDFNFNYDENLEVDFIYIPPMLIQPFLENSIKHGFKNIDQKGKLEVYITDNGQSVEFIIQDNGKGIQKGMKKAKNHQSMAMKIFEKRRKLIQQKHNKDFNFEMINLIDENPKLSGVKIYISIPILEND